MKNLETNLTIKKLEKITIELTESPYTGIGQPEQLKHHLTGYWSRRLNQKDRIIYQVIEYPEGAVVIVSALGHY
ncbi:MAG: Txe/YoeB family addiction module toxin [Saprospiraceae bacterium]